MHRFLRDRLLAGRYLDFYSKWLKDLAVDQLPDGGVANVVPNIEETHTEANWLMKTAHMALPAGAMPRL